MFQYAYVPGLSDDAVMTELLRLSREHSVCTTEEMYPMIARFADGYSDRGYSYTMIKRVTHTLRCLYVFLDMHGLDYCPEVSWEWYTLIGDRIGRNRRAWKRVLALLAALPQTGKYASIKLWDDVRPGEAYGALPGMVCGRSQRICGLDCTQFP